MGSFLIDKDFDNGWNDRKSGTGSLSVVNGILNTKGNGSVNAAKEYLIPVVPGQTIEFKIMGKSSSGFPAISIDLVSFDNVSKNIDSISIDGNDWKLYEMKISVPLNATQEYVRIVIGVYQSMTGVVDGSFQKPSLKIYDGLGSELIIASGLANISEGVATLNKTFRNFGVEKVEIVGNSTLKVTLNRKVYTAMRPIVMVSGSPDSYQLPMGGQLTNGSDYAYFNIKWSTISGWKDILTGSYNVFFKVSM